MVETGAGAFAAAEELNDHVGVEVFDCGWAVKRID
jgi:hypothetical protein